MGEEFDQRISLGQSSNYQDTILQNEWRGCIVRVTSPFKELLFETEQKTSVLKKSAQLPLIGANWKIRIKRKYKGFSPIVLEWTTFIW